METVSIMEYSVWLAFIFDVSPFKMVHQSEMETVYQNSLKFPRFIIFASDINTMTACKHLHYGLIMAFLSFEAARYGVLKCTLQGSRKEPFRVFKVATFKIFLKIKN